MFDAVAVVTGSAGSLGATRRALPALLGGLMLCAAACFGAKYPWQESYAGMTTNGDLYWQPTPFVFEAGASIKYIDYEGGNDANAGTSTTTAWKHHPWDPNATGLANTCTGIHTYVFKRGVAYRGTLVANESGVAGNPIRLTSDPAWGTGEAMLYASEVTTSGWQQGSHPLMPQSNLAWYVTLPFAPRRVWFTNGTNIQRLALARMPNWTEANPDDVKGQWWTWNDDPVFTTYNGQQYYKCMDSIHLTRTSDYYSNAIIWAEYFPMMCTPYAAKVVAVDTPNRGVICVGPWGSSQKPVKYDRYFLEDKPQYLDAAGEFWFDSSASRLYVRLPGDLDPNGQRVEAARYMNIVDSTDMNYVQFSGLAFRFNNAYWDLTAGFTVDRDVVNACIRMLGSGTDISIHHCRFEQVSKAIRIEVANNACQVDNVMIADNEIIDTDHEAIEMSDFGSTVPPYGLMKRVDILRNRLYRIGQRPYPPTHGHAISIQFPETAEIAGNILDRTWGSGLFIFGGKPSDSYRDVPFTRILIHHNKVTDPLLNCNDWGGIETWQGGPFYVYSNISGNPGGYWHPSFSQGGRGRFGFAFYLDGSFKNYLFNNVTWGNNNTLSSPLCNAAAFQCVLGFDNVFANNTAYKFAIAFRRNSEQTGRNTYIGNIVADFSDWGHYYDKGSGGHVADAQYDYNNLAFSKNAYYLPPPKFGTFEESATTYTSFDTFRSALAARKTRRSDVGQISTNMPFRDAATHDFRPADGAAVIDAGVKLFTPWALYRPLGEWHFRRDNVNPAYVQDENWYMTAAYSNRDMYYTTRRFHLTGVNITSNDYIASPLESWCASALQLNGTNQYASVAMPTSGLTVDAGTNNFIIEAYFKTQPGHTGGVIVVKADTTNGYALEIDRYGSVCLRVRAGGQDCVKPSSMMVNDGQWHHVIAEFDRTKGMWLYVDGARGTLAPIGAMPAPGVSIANPAGLLVGRGPGGAYFAGAIDYLRLAGCALRDAKTTIDELYEWEFNGPALKDFLGNGPLNTRDAGAFEWSGAGTALPRILAQPASITVMDPGAASLNVFAQNALAYQWHRGGVGIAGATNARYTITAVNGTYGGMYDVVISNAAGAVTSDLAALTVIPEPAVLALAACAALLMRRMRRRG